MRWPLPWIMLIYFSAKVSAVIKDKHLEGYPVGFVSDFAILPHIRQHLMTCAVNESVFCAMDPISTEQVLSVSKIEFFEEWIKHDKENRNSRIFDFLSVKFDLSNITEVSLREITKSIAASSTKIAQKWNSASRIRERFLSMNKTWLEGTDFHFKVSVNPPVATTSTEGAQRPGRPQKSFEESSYKTKKRRVDGIVSEWSAKELAIAAEVASRSEGKRNVAQAIKRASDGTSFEQNVSCPNGRLHTNIGTCAYYMDAKCTSHTYKATRKWEMKAGHKVLPSYYSIRPGVDKPAYVRKSSLKYLGFIVFGRASNIINNGNFYNYHEVKKMMRDPDLDFSKRTLIFACGFLDSGQNFISKIMGNAYRKLGYNVLAVQAHYFQIGYYPRVVRILPAVAYHLAEMLKNLTAVGFNPKTTELLGISLGGQVAALIAKKYHNITGVKFDRITGLDPSGPCFRYRSTEHRLYKTDADFVDIVVTNMDGYGTGISSGHSHIFVNGGDFQPAELYWIACAGLCSHMRAYTIWFTALTNQNKFIAVKCDSREQARSHKCFDRVPLETNVLGLRMNRTNTGTFYLATHNDYPYYLGKNGLTKDALFWDKTIGYYNKDKVIWFK